MSPPTRFSDATFGTYQAATPSQAHALEAARQFAAQLRTPLSPWMRIRQWLGQRVNTEWHGLYFVGPVGTGKTHLLAAMHHALHPEVPCGFLHSSALFRMTTPPAQFADTIANQIDVLCVDEVEIDDPANEVRLVALLRALEQRGVKLLATSNVKPDQFMSNRMGSGRFERFLQEEFSERYRIVFVGGTDYRQHQAPTVVQKGCAWIGPADAARSALRDAYDSDEGTCQWMDFATLREASRTTSHERLLNRFAALDSLYLANVAIADTDDALRLLRIVDDLYVRPDAPRLYFSASVPPEDWFHTDEHEDGLASDVAKKFTRTTSRLHALCHLEHLPSATSERA